MRLHYVLPLAAVLAAGCQNISKQSDSQDLKFSGDRGVAESIDDGVDQDLETASVDPDSNDDQAIKEGTETVETASASGQNGGPKIMIASYRPPKVGTIVEFKNNWASLEPRVVYEVVSTDTTYKGKAAIKLSAIEGTGKGASTFYSLKDANLLGFTDQKGNPISSFVKVEERLKFPMQPGDRWVAQWKTLDHKSKKTQSGGGLVTVVGVENIKTAAGNFKTMKIKLPVPAKAGKGLKHFIWYSPKLGLVVQERISNAMFSWVKVIERVEYPSAQG